MANGLDMDNIEDIYPMSDIEKGMVFVSLADPNKRPFYIEDLFCMKYLNFDINTFRKSIDLMVDKHEILRTSFELYAYGKPVQFVHKVIESDIQYYDISDIKHEEQVAYIKKVKAKDRDFLFSFESGEVLWKIRVLNLGRGKICILFIHHHAILDGWSVALMMKEVSDIYMNLENDINFKPNKLKTSYKEYLLREYVAKKDNEVKEFWKKELDQYKRTDYAYLKSNANCSKESQTFKYEINNYLISKLREKGLEYHSSTRNICFAAFSLAMNMFNYENDMVLGFLTNNRPICEDGDQILGCFLNIAPIRIIFSHDMSYKHYIKAINKKISNAIDNGNLSLFEIARIIGEKADDRNPIVDVYFNFIDFYVYDEINNNFANDDIPIESQSATNTSFDFTVDCTDGNIVLDILYNNENFSLEVVEKICCYFENALRYIVSEPEKIIQKKDLLLEDEKITLIHAFNETEVAYQSNKLIFEWLIESAKKYPHGIAAKINEKKLTYKMLNEKSNQLARILREKGVSNNSIVLVKLERHFEMLIGIFAILKAGGAYLPLNINIPKKRMDYIIENSESKIILTKSQHMKYDFNHLEDVILLDDVDKLLKGVSPDEVEIINKASDLCYVIYTSGTTGTPKGVMIEHRSVVNRINWMQRKYPIGVHDVILQKTPYTFDVSVWELFWWTYSGATVCFLEQDMEKDPSKIVEAIQQNKVTTMHFVPSMLNSFLEFVEKSSCQQKLQSLTYVFASGEALELYQVKKFYELLGNDNVKLLNLYGPTEATVDVSYYDCSHEDDSSIPIGKPIDNTKFIIVDNNLQLQPVGSYGEICIEGIGVAKGYLNNYELSKEKFVQSIISNENKMYRTGDLGKWLSNGNVEYLGRIDHQVKVRGFRIELGEIENNLLSHRSIVKAVVLDKKDKFGDKYLCAYITSNIELKHNEIKEHLLQYVPEYMIPAKFISVENIPLTAHGKADRKKLLAIEDDFLTNEFEAPTNDLEKILIEIYSDILEMSHIGIKDKFFDLGGHSLKAIVLVNKIKTKLNVTIPLAIIFKDYSIKELSNYIQDIKNNEKFSTQENLVLLKRGGDKNLFLVHAIQGTVDTYIDFCQQLDSDFNCIGIQADFIEDYAPRNIAIEEIASRYIRLIKSVQPNGPYTITGWSVGGIIAYEIVRQLERQNEEVEYFAMIDSAPLNLEKNETERIEDFNYRFEIEAIRRVLKDESFLEGLEEELTVRGIWSSIIRKLENKDIKSMEEIIDLSLVETIHGQNKFSISEYIYTLNIGRTLNRAIAIYKPSTKINSILYYFKAEDSEINNEKRWSNYCYKAVEYYNIGGNHDSIFTLPYVKCLSKKIDKTLNN